MCIHVIKKRDWGLGGTKQHRQQKNFYASDFLTINRGKIWTNYMKTDLKVFVFKRSDKKQFHLPEAL